MAPSPAVEASGAPPPGGRRPAGFFRRVVAAQEFGLVVVIAVMMLGLTLATPTITANDFYPQPADAIVTPGTDGASFLVSIGGVATVYRAADGWSYRTGGDSPVLVRERRVNKFLNRDNLIIIANAAAFIAVMAVGMTGIIIMGGIDLSVGSIYALSAVTGAAALHALNEAMPNAPGIVAIPVGLVVCCGVGALCGLVNGGATVGLRVHPFIITLGGMAVYRGIAFVTTDGQSIGGFPASFTARGFKAEAFGLNPVPMLIMVAVALVGAFVGGRTVFGRRTYAIGGNETAARYAGVPVGRVKIVLFMITGALTGLSAAMLCGYFGAAASDAGPGYELRVIAASVVGGASLSGGRGSILGAMLGALVMQLIENGIVVLGIDSNYTNIVIGLAIVLAVVVDQTKARFTGGRK